MAKHQRYQPRQEMHGSDFEIFNYQDARKYSVPVHHHDFYEIYFYLSGNVQFMVGDRTYSLLPGDILLMAPGVLHRAIVEPDTNDRRIVLWINKSYLENLCRPGEDLTACFNTGQPHLRPGAVERSALQETALELVSEFYGGEYCSGLAAQGLFMRLMAELNRMALSGAGGIQSDTTAETLISRVLSYIGAHYAEELSLDTLSAHFFVSKYHLSHEFSSTVGTSVYKYIILKRLAAARQLIAGGESPGDACRECGYRDYANFYRAFSALYGENPGSAKPAKQNRAE